MRVCCTRVRAAVCRRGTVTTRHAQAQHTSPRDMVTCASRAYSSNSSCAASACHGDAHCQLRCRRVYAAMCTRSGSSSLTMPTRPLASVSAVRGVIPPPPGGFVTKDIVLDHCANHGGSFSRAVYASRDIAYGREIMHLPAFCMHISDDFVDTAADGSNGSSNSSGGSRWIGGRRAARAREAARLRSYVLQMTRDVFTRLVYGTPAERDYIMSRVMTLMSGGNSYFTRERDVYEFAEQVHPPTTPSATAAAATASATSGLRNAAAYLRTGAFSSYDLQKLPLILEFNRVDVAYQGRRGVCVFPEACYFNHACEPNVEVTVSYNTVKSNFVLSARAVRPIRAGEELYISYLPGNTYPITRLILALHQRWGFECACVRCRSRIINVLVLFTLLIAPFALYGMSRLSERKRARSDTM